MEQIRIVRRRSRVAPLVLTLIVLALIVAAVLYLARDTTGVVQLSLSGLGVG